MVQEESLAWSETWPFKSIQTEQIEVFYSLIKSLSPRMMTQICVIFRHTKDVALVLVQPILKVIVIQ